MSRWDGRLRIGRVQDGRRRVTADADFVEVGPHGRDPDHAGEPRRKPSVQRENWFGGVLLAGRSRRPSDDGAGGLRPAGPWTRPACGGAVRAGGRRTALGLNVHPADRLLASTSAPAPSAAGNQPDRAEVLARGAVIDLSDTGMAWTVAAAWRQQIACDVDVVAFAVDEREQVPRGQDFVFYSSPEYPDGTVRLATDGPTEQAVTADLERLLLESTGSPSPPPPTEPRPSPTSEQSRSPPPAGSARPRPPAPPSTPPPNAP
ncbi:TerD family protein [Streptomyces sp. NPDC055210]